MQGTRLHRKDSQSESVKGALVAAGLAVCVLGLAAELWHGLSNNHEFDELLFLFSLSYEQNLPTWYSSILLFAAGWSLARRAAATDSHRRYWQVMALGLILASLDEFMELHERLGGLVGCPGVLYFDWVIPASLVMAVLAIVFIPFVRALPAETRRRFLLAGGVYLGGALAMELPLGYWTDLHGTDNLGYAGIDWVEESLEILGASLFLLAVIDDEASA